jgi:hypothetical protein
MPDPSGIVCRWLAGFRSGQPWGGKSSFRRVSRQRLRSFEHVLDLNRHKAAPLVRPPAGATGDGCVFAPFKGRSGKAACLATVERELETPFIMLPEAADSFAHLKAVATVIGQASGVRWDNAWLDSSRAGWTERMV